ncbi:putative alpha/Beta hydrolase [Helianthus annuus]|nr:putative alpha/Beta hydrolase [Helianthus annuus]KAJ0598503.1 putative alpha/Beta hydrolase [Helianthus annuus]KAJ0759102.1 putative alpha/Beta hydrolase [Helianthus annuus]KAJ0762751.1 putative alpha/Beta hydrolase [Helianthus annuus]KAJ0928668.1 putative alpha/Beta hydrolase [Helianthus annuus]
MINVANASFRVIAPDYNGYGLSDIPQELEKTIFADLVNDTASILDYVAICKIHLCRSVDFGFLTIYIYNCRKIKVLIYLLLMY